MDPKFSECWLVVRKPSAPAKLPSSGLFQFLVMLEHGGYAAIYQLNRAMRITDSSPKEYIAQCYDMGDVFRMADCTQDISPEQYDLEPLGFWDNPFSAVKAAHTAIAAKHSKPHIWADGKENQAIETNSAEDLFEENIRYTDEDKSAQVDVFKLGSVKIPRA